MEQSKEEQKHQRWLRDVKFPQIRESLKPMLDALGKSCVVGIGPIEGEEKEYIRIDDALINITGSSVSCAVMDVVHYLVWKEAKDERIKLADYESLNFHRWK